MAGQAAPTDDINAVKQDLSALRKDLEALVKSVSANAADKSKETVGVVRDKGREGVETLAKQVEERPIASIAASFGVGLLIGCLVRR
ncbi:MAG: YqjD family protein [Alphaproteobacteria bacterium]